MTDAPDPEPNDGPKTDPVPATPPEDDPQQGHEPTTEDGEA